MNINDLMNANYPIPDPSWDYAQIWYHSQQANTELQKLLQFMGTLENASPQSDAEIKLLLDSIGQRLNSARRLIDS
jgi:hypothetical protein